MKAKTPKRADRKALTPGVTVATIDPGCYFEFTETGLELPKSTATNHKKSSTGNGAAKKTPSVSDRRYLKDIEIFLTNCVNLASRLEDKRGAKILQLLREAREFAVHVRG